jgi:hypothetical protein
VFASAAASQCAPALTSANFTLSSASASASATSPLPLGSLSTACLHFQQLCSTFNLHSISVIRIQRIATLLILTFNQRGTFATFTDRRRHLVNHQGNTNKSTHPIGLTRTESEQVPALAYRLYASRIDSARLVALTDGRSSHARHQVATRHTYTHRLVSLVAMTRVEVLRPTNYVRTRYVTRYVTTYRYVTTLRRTHQGRRIAGASQGPMRGRTNGQMADRCHAA